MTRAAGREAALGQWQPPTALYVMTMGNQRWRRLLATIVFAGTSLRHDVEAFTSSPFHSLRVERHDTTTSTASSLPTLHVPKPSHLTLLKADASDESSLEEGSILGASLLFAGTAVGAGMLALPAETLDSGFIPTLSGLIICWVFTYVTSLATLEASWTALQLATADVVDESSSSSEASGGTGGGGGTSFLSISRRALGVPGEIATGLLFWFLLTAIVVAYTAEGGQLIAQFVDEISSSAIQVAPAIGSAIFAIFFGTLGTFGTSRIDAINRVFVLGLVSTFVGLVGFGLSQIDASNLISQSDWTTLYPNLISIGILSFGAQNVVPTLLNYLGGDPNRTRRAILFGSLAPLALYTIWEAVFLGIVSVNGVAEESKMDVITVLGATGGPIIKDFVEVFSACAIGSSMAGASVSLVDFFEDGIGSFFKERGSDPLADENQESLGPSARILAAFLALGPPVILAYAFPDIFLVALEEAGLLGGVSLYGILPALSLLSLRRFTADESDALQMPGRIGGGVIALYVLAGVSSLLVLPEVIHLGSLVTN